MLSVYLLSQAGLLESFQRPCRVVGWPPGRLRADHQVAAELEEQRHQRGIAAVGEGGDALVGGQFGGRSGAEIERDAAEERLVVADVFGAEGLVGLLADGGQGGGVALRGVGGDVAVVLEVGGGGEDEGGGVVPSVRAVSKRASKRMAESATWPDREAPSLQLAWPHFRLAVNGAGLLDVTCTTMALAGWLAKTSRRHSMPSAVNSVVAMPVSRSSERL